VVACPFDFTIQADASDAQLVADVGGYFRAVGTTQNGLIWGGAHVNGAPPAAVTRSFSRFPGTPAVTVIRLALGQWEVNFGGNVSTRFYALVPGNAVSGVPPAAFCDTTPRAGVPNAVFVFCHDAGGVGIDTNFYLQVY
jgi:hypothetical protein